MTSETVNPPGLPSSCNDSFQVGGLAPYTGEVIEKLAKNITTAISAEFESRIEAVSDRRLDAVFGSRLESVLEQCFEDATWIKHLDGVIERILLRGLLEQRIDKKLDEHVVDVGDSVFEKRIENAWNRRFGEVGALVECDAFKEKIDAKLDQHFGNAAHVEINRRLDDRQIDRRVDFVLEQRLNGILNKQDLDFLLQKRVDWMLTRRVGGGLLKQHVDSLLRNRLNENFLEDRLYKALNRRWEGDVLERRVDAVINQRLEIYVTDERIDQAVKRRLEDVEKRIDVINQRLEVDVPDERIDKAVERRLEDVKKLIDAISRRLEVDATDERVDRAVKRRLEDVEKRIDAITRRSEVDVIDRAVKRRFEDVEKRIDAINRRLEVDVIDKAVKRRFEDVERRIDVINRRTEVDFVDRAVKRRLEDVDKRIDGINRRLEVDVIDGRIDRAVKRRLEDVEKHIDVTNRRLEIDLTDDKIDRPVERRLGEAEHVEICPENRVGCVDDSFRKKEVDDSSVRNRLDTASASSYVLNERDERKISFENGDCVERYLDNNHPGCDTSYLPSRHPVDLSHQRLMEQSLEYCPTAVPLIDLTSFNIPPLVTAFNHPHFDPQTELWVNYESDFNAELSRMGISTEKDKKRCLLSTMTQEMWSVLEASVSPQNITNDSVTYRDIMELFRRHFDDTPLQNFRRCRRGDRPVYVWVQELQERALMCRFGTRMDEELNLQVLLGVDDEECAQKLMESKPESYAEAVAIVEMFERTWMQDRRRIDERRRSEEEEYKRKLRIHTRSRAISVGSVDHSHGMRPRRGVQAVRQSSRLRSISCDRSSGRYSCSR